MIKLFIFFLLICCGSPKDIVIPADPPAPNIEESLQFYLDAWVLVRPGNKPITTPVSFDTFEDRNILGVCITWTDDNTGAVTREIRIDRESFQSYLSKDPFITKIIIYHELGHCELERDHTEDLADPGGGLPIPFSILFPSLWQDPSVYSRHEGHYMNELFGGDGFFKRIPATRSSENIIMVLRESGRTGRAIIN